MQAFVEINEKGDRMEVHFQYDPAAVRAIKQVPGARFIPKPAPHWTLPLDLTSARILREQFGDGLQLGSAVKAWGRDAVAKERNLTALGAADDADLEVLPKKLPKLNKWLRPYQRADVAFLAQADAVNANQPGLGKTAEAIGAVFEAGLDSGAVMVVAPKTSLETVWLAELTRWQPHPVLLTSGDDSKERRQEVIEEAWQLAGEDKPFWLVLNHNMLRYQRDKGAEHINEGGHLVAPTVPVFGELYNIPWNVVIVDEYHKMGLTNPKSLMTKSLKDVPREKLIMLSGTPMGGKPIKLWTALNLVDPGSFTSKWRWAGQWLEVEDKEYEKQGEAKVAKVIHGIRPEREEAFYAEHAPYLLRRTKAEVLPQLPPKQRIIRMCEMMPEQRKQYNTIAAEAEIKIEEENLSVIGVLAEYTRLKQFSTCYHTVKQMGNGEMKVSPIAEKALGTSKKKTVMSGKLPQLIDLLEERGITKDDAEGDEQAVIFSQYSQVADMVHEYLTAQGIATAKITGSVSKKGERTKIQQEFNAEGGPRVLVMTTGAGGVSITLDERASTVIFMDETWDPDDQEQAEDRVHRASRMHQVMVYYLRSRDSIEEYIADITEGKKLTNEQILDELRQRIKAERAAEEPKS